MNLRRMIYSKNDLIKLKLGSNEKKIMTTLTSASYRTEEDVKFSAISAIPFKSKKIFRVNCGQEKLIIRKLNDNIKRIYGVKQSNRSDITKQILALLQEANPFNAIRVDIKDFYESIDFSNATSKIHFDTILSPTSKRILKSLESHPNLNGTIPRGINISATLTELYMREFDRCIRQHPGVYFYSRYVDDILIFCFTDELLDITKVAEFLPPGLKINSQKCSTHIVNCRCKRTCKCKNNCKCAPNCKCRIDLNSYEKLEYLGYEYRFPDIHRTEKYEQRKVEVGLSRRKIARIKKRIILSLLDYTKNNDQLLLIDRLKTLTGNCEFEVKGSIKVRSGLAYNYQLLTDPQKELEGLTLFLRKSIHSKKGSLGKKLNKCLSPILRSHLGKLCFYHAYSNKITYYFDSKRLATIRECWKNG